MSALNRVSVARPTVLWKQVLALAAVQSAVSLMWVMYGLYLPQLLGELGMPIEIAAVLMIVENGLAIPLQPLVGGLSDRALHWAGSRLPFIGVGIVLAAALFIAIPVLPMVFQSTVVVQRLALFILVAWSVAMVLFYSPVVSLLAKYTTISHLPLANSLLVLGTGLVGTTRSSVNQLIVGLGPLSTFLIGSLVLLAAAAALRSLDPPDPPPALVDPAPVHPSLGLTLGVIGVMGCTIGWVLRLTMDGIAKTFLAQMPQLNTGHVLTSVAIALAILAVPAGWLSSRFDNRPMMAVGLLLALLAVGLMAAWPMPGLILLATVLLVLGLSLVQTGAFPLAIALMPAPQAGLGVGMYLGGLAAASTLFGLLIPQPEFLSRSAGMILEAIALALTLGCIAATYRLGDRQTQV